MDNGCRSRLRWLLVLGTALGLASCVPSLHGIATEETTVFDPALVGSWSDGDTTWTFTRAGGKRYTLEFSEDDQSGIFNATLVKLDGTLFLDLRPAELTAERPDFWKFHLLRSHTFLWVEEIQPVLKMRVMNPQWLKEHLEAHPDAIEFTVVDDLPILTAPTGKLQKFLVALTRRGDANDPDNPDRGPFGEPSELRKAP